ncbi:hypothetical protein Tco_1447968 [Tanacetum coccineum]
MLNRNCKTSFVKPEFLKKAQTANPCLYDIGCYNDNPALMLALESDERIHLAQESRSKLNLKGQLQDKGIGISELKKLIEKMKGKSMENNFEKPSVIDVVDFRTWPESVEARLLVYKKNESIYEEDIKIVDKCKTGLGYNAVPPPYIGNFMPPKPDLSFSGLEEFVNEPIVSEPTVKKPIVKTNEAKASADKPKAVRKNNGAPIIEDWVSDNEKDDVP